MNNLARNNFHNVHQLYMMRDVMAAYVYLGIWPKEYYEEMDRRIASWNRRILAEADS